MRKFCHRGPSHPSPQHERDQFRHRSSYPGSCRQTSPCCRVSFRYRSDLQWSPSRYWYLYQKSEIKSMTSIIFSTNNQKMVRSITNKCSIMRIFKKVIQIKQDKEILIYIIY